MITIALPQALSNKGDCFLEISKTENIRTLNIWYSGETKNILIASILDPMYSAYHGIYINSEDSEHYEDLGYNAICLTSDLLRDILYLRDNFEYFYKLMNYKRIEEEVEGEEEEEEIENANSPLYFFFDTETNGLPENNNASPYKYDSWPRIVQIGFVITNRYYEILEKEEYLIKPEGFTITRSAESIHGISNELAMNKGLPLKNVLDILINHIKSCEYIVAHNLAFDKNVLAAEFIRNGYTNLLENKIEVCTMLSTINYCSEKDELNPKYPSLEELHLKLFGKTLDSKHTALSDTLTLLKCFRELKFRDLI